MANPKVGQRDKQGRYWTGSEWKTLNQVMQAQQKIPGKTGETVKLPGVGEIKYTGDKYGWQTAATVTSRQNPAQQTSQPKPKPKPKDSRLDSPIAGKGPKGNEVGSTPAAPAPTPLPPSGGLSGANRGTQTPTRRPAPVPQAPQASPVAKYMAAASAARKIQDPVQRAAEMEKVKQTGLDIWKNKYKDTLAKRVGPTGQQLGTGQSVMAKQADELRNLRKPSTPTPQVQAKSSLPGGDYSPAATANMSQRTKNILGTRKEAYDLVLEYLLSEGHADTVEEAHYVMMQMSAEHIQDIVEDVYMAPIKPETKPKPTKPEGEGRSILGPGRSGDFGKGYERRDKPTVPSKTPPANPGRAEGGTGLPPGQVPPNVKRYASGG